MNETIQEIKRRINLVELISEYVKLRPSGRYFVGLCPFHQEKTPSFSVSPEKQVWHCFGCGEGGDVITFLEKIEGIEFLEALRQLARRVGVTLPIDSAKAPGERNRLLEIHEWACSFYESALKRSPEAQRYLSHRGLTEEDCRRWRIGYAPEGWENLKHFLEQQGVTETEMERAGLLTRKTGGGTAYDRFRKRLMLPIMNLEGQVIAFGGRVITSEATPKYLNSPETRLFSKSHTLYGLHIARQFLKEGQPALLMEGYLDVITAHRYGFRTAIATLGTALTPNHARLLRRYTDQVILLYDADSAGLKAALRSLELFEQVGLEVKVAHLPGGEDPDSLLRSVGADALQEILDQALPVLEYRFQHLYQQYGTTTEAGRNLILREAIPLLASLPETHLGDWPRRLAELKAQGRADRVAFWEEDIRREIRNYSQRQRKKTSRPENRKTLPSSPRETSVGPLRWEEEVLRASLHHPDIAQKVMSQIAPEAFGSKIHRLVAQLILTALAHYQEEWQPSLWNYPTGEEGIQAQNLVARLLLDPTPPPGEKAVEQTILRLKRYWSRQQVKTLLNQGSSPPDEQLLRQIVETFSHH